jgi:multiple sugar transport system ATP-binding protein
VAVIEELGSDTHAIFTIDAPPVDSDELRAREQEEDELTLVGDSAVFNARVDPRSSARPGATLRLAVDPARFHFFDGETGANLLREAPKAASGERAARPAASPG